LPSGCPRPYTKSALPCTPLNRPPARSFLTPPPLPPPPLPSAPQIKGPKKELSRKEKKAADKLRKARKERGEEVTESEEE
jgi:hypothetical protein